MNSRVLADTSFPGLRLTGLGHLGLFLDLTAQYHLNLSHLASAPHLPRIILPGDDNYLCCSIEMSSSARSARDRLSSPHFRPAKALANRSGRTLHFRSPPGTNQFKPRCREAYGGRARARTPRTITKCKRARDHAN